MASYYFSWLYNWWTKNSEPIVEKNEEDDEFTLLDTQVQETKKEINDDKIEIETKETKKGEKEQLNNEQIQQDSEKKAAATRNYPYLDKSNKPYVPPSHLPKAMIVLTEDELQDIIKKLKPAYRVKREFTPTAFGAEIQNKFVEKGLHNL